MATAFRSQTKIVLRNGVLAAAVAALVAVGIAMLARAASSELTVGGTAIPIGAFAFWTAVATAVGAVIAVRLRDPWRFRQVTVVLTAVSLIPPLAFADGWAGKIILSLAHVVVAAVVIPSLLAALRVPRDA